MRRNRSIRPVIVPLGEPVVRVAVVLVLVAAAVAILTWLGWMPG